MQALLDELRSYLENGLALSMIEGDAVDGPGFHVDVEAVDEAARGITQSVQDQDNFELRGLVRGCRPIRACRRARRAHGFRRPLERWFWTR